jgi:hypothetical protein
MQRMGIAIKDKKDKPKTGNNFFHSTVLKWTANLLNRNQLIKFFIDAGY